MRYLVEPPRPATCDPRPLDIGSEPFDPDPDHASEIEVLFTPEGDNATRIDLEHRGFENLVGGADIAASVGSPDGWNGVLRAFGDIAEDR